MTAWPATTEYAGSSAHLTELLAAIAAGQQDALAQLYHLTRTAVYGLSLSYLKNAHDAQDITQDVFVHVWDHAPQYRPTGSPMGWLLTVCRNLCLMRLRRTERHAAAKAAALTHAGVSESRAYDMDVELDDEDGRWVYEVEFKADGMEYEYVIDAYTGAVLEYDMEQDD